MHLLSLIRFHILFNEQGYRMSNGDKETKWAFWVNAVSTAACVQEYHTTNPKSTRTIRHRISDSGDLCGTKLGRWHGEHLSGTRRSAQLGPVSTAALTASIFCTDLRKFNVDSAQFPLRPETHSENEVLASAKKKKYASGGHKPLGSNPDQSVMGCRGFN